LNLSSKIDGLLEVMLEVADCGIFPPELAFAELALIVLELISEVRIICDV
jgi:hypothetical protein